MYIASLGQEACVIMNVFSCVPFSEKFYSYLGLFFATTRMFVQQKICLQTGEVLPEMWEFSLPRSCPYGIPLMIMRRVMGSGRKWKVFFLNLSFRKKFCATFVSLFEETDVCMFVSILHHIQCFQMGIK